MFFEQYLGCYRSIFSQMLICYSWEYTLAECTLYFEFEGYRRIIFKNPRVVLFAIWCKFVQIHAYLKTVIAPYIGWVETPKLYFIFWKPMSWEYEYMHDFGRSDVVTSSYWHLNFKKMYFSLMTSWFPSFNWGYLAYWWSIFSHILICCSYDNSLRENTIQFSFWWRRHSGIFD